MMINKGKTHTRFYSLDALRGFVVLFMLFINFITLFSYDLPQLLKHNQPTMLPGDLVAPLFQFVIGLSLVLAVDKRKKNKEDMRSYVLKRAILLLLVGLVLDAGFEKFTMLRWGILQSLSIGLLLAYALLPLPAFYRGFAAVVILATYSLLLQYMPWFSEKVTLSVFGGPLGAISYGTVAVFGTIAGEWLYLREKGGIKLNGVLSLAIILILLSLVANVFVPFNRLTVSASYMLFSAGLSFILAALSYLFFELKGYKNNALELFGQNALAVWIMHYLLFWWPLVLFLGGACCFLPWPLGIAATVMAIALFYVIVDVLSWKKMRISL